MSAATTPRALAEASGVGLVSLLFRAVAARRQAAAEVQDHVRGVKAALDAAFELDPGASLKGDQEERVLLFNETPLPLKSHARAIDGLLTHFASVGVSEIRVSRKLTEPQVAQLISILRRPRDAQDAFSACRKVVEGLWSTGLRGTVDVISLEQLGHKLARTVKADAATRARLIYGRVLATLTDYLAHEKSDELQRYFSWKLMKGIQGLVDLALESERQLLSLAAVRGADIYMVQHATATAALSVLVGKKVGLPRSLLVQLGYGALFHASGKMRTAPPIINKAASSRTPAEAKEFARHPYRGVGAILEQRRLDDAVVTSALVAFQYDTRRGIPVTRKPLKAIHPLSQIVALCQGFDAQWASRRGQPFEALAAATQDPSRPFEPVLVHVLGALVAALPSAQAT